MKKYQNPETNIFVVRAVEMLCASGTPGSKTIPYNPGTFNREDFVG